MGTFWDKLETAKSQNGANLLRIDCDILLTPIEMAMLNREAIAKQADQEVLEWLQKREHQSGTKMLTRPKRFFRKVINDCMSMYSLGNASDGKSLLIAFTGLGCMFMMPKSVFLQQFDATKWDILYIDAEPMGFKKTYDLSELEAARRVHYFYEGGLMEAVEKIAANVRQSIDLKAYDNLVCAGVSSGASISMLLAAELNAKKGVGIGARLDPQEPIDIKKLQASADTTALYSVYSRNYERDKDSAYELQERINAQPVPIVGVKRHNPFKKVIRSGKIRRLLPSLFDPLRDPMDSARSYASAIKLSGEFD